VKKKIIFSTKGYIGSFSEMSSDARCGNRLRAFPTLENAFLSMNQGIGVCIEAKIEKF
jgi:hypothetical protein